MRRVTIAWMRVVVVQIVYPKALPVLLFEAFEVLNWAMYLLVLDKS